MPEKKKQLNRITLSSTGLWAGEVAVISLSAAWRGCRLTCEQGMVPPARAEYNAWPKDQLDVFFTRLYGLVRHRPNMTSVDAVREWFLQTAVDIIPGDGAPYVFMTQAPDVKVCLEALGGDVANEPNTITEENVQRLVGATLTPLEALELFEETPAGNDDPHRRRLLFMLDYWTLETDEMPDAMPADTPVLVLSATGVRRSAVADHSIDERRRFVRLPSANQRLYVLPESDPSGIEHCRTPGQRRALVEQALDPLDDDTLGPVVRAIEKLSLGVLKSLLQKIIRTGADRVQLDGVTHDNGSAVPDADAALVLAAVVAHMLVRSMFNPHGGGLETGLAAMFKRGAICCVEDAWPVDEGAVGVEWMMVCAAVALARRRWAPPQSYLVRAIRLLDACRRSRSCCTYDLQRDAPRLPALPIGQPLGTVCFLLDHFVGGMTGDHRMMRDVYAQESLPLITASTDSRVAVMPIYHCLDQHCTTALPYLFPPGQQAAALVDGSLRSCAVLFSRLFRECTGLNPRRVEVAGASTLLTLRNRTEAERAFFTEVQTVQQRLWLSLLLGHRPHSTAASTAPCELQQPYDRLPQAVGVQKITVNRRVHLWTLDPQEAAQINVATKQTVARAKPVVGGGGDDQAAPGSKRSAPSVAPAAKRSATEQTLDEREREHECVRRAVREKLSGSGLRVPGLNNALIKMDTDGNGLDVITVNGTEWDKARAYTLQVPAATWNADVTAVDSLVAPRDSIDLSRCVERLRQVMTSLGVSAGGCQLALSMLKSPARVLVFPRPDRDGGPSRDAGGSSATKLHFEAWAVCKAFSDWSALLVCPRPGNDLSQFETPAKYLDLRLWLAGKLSASELTTINPEDCDRAVNNTIAWYESCSRHAVHAWQQRALRVLGYRVVDGGHRAHFLWMDMGSGKTDTAIMFSALLQVLRRCTVHTMRTLFVTTNSAITTVYNNSVALGLRCETIKRAQDAYNFLPRGGGGNHVVFVSHDTLKSPKVLPELLPLLSTSLVVVDEVHECTGVGTQRSSAVQLVSNVARQVLFMTATPLRSSREKASLHALLQHVANFPVKTDDDFLVASGAMVHPLVYDRVDTTELLQSAQTEANTPRLMRHLPPRLGGTSSADRMDSESLAAALEDAYAETDVFLAAAARREVDAGSRPFVVCRNYAHCQRMVTLLCDSYGFSRSQVWAPVEGENIQSVEANSAVARAQRVGVVPIRQHSGYSATHFNVRLRGVFPSNQAHRDQIDGRIARSGQPVSPVRLITVHCGITSLIVNKHLDASSTVKLMDQLNGIRMPQH